MSTMHCDDHVIVFVEFSGLGPIVLLEQLTTIIVLTPTIIITTFVL